MQIDVNMMEKAVEIYGSSPASKPERDAWLKGFLYGVNFSPSDSLLGAKKKMLEELAPKMRELWPSGEKQGKYPWRCSIKDIVERLMSILSYKNVDILEYSIDDCLRACRRYINQYQHNTTYMQTLKYFIFRKEKKSELVLDDGRILPTYKSSFLDFLQAEDNSIPDGEEMEDDILFSESNDYYMGNDNLI